MGKAKKIIAGVLVVAVAGTGIGAGLMQLRKNSQKEVEVTPVSGLLQEYYQQSTNLDGQIASSALPMESPLFLKDAVFYGNYSLRMSSYVGIVGDHQD